MSSPGDRSAETPWPCSTEPKRGTNQGPSRKITQALYPATFTHLLFLPFSHYSSHLAVKVGSHHCAQTKRGALLQKIPAADFGVFLSHAILLSLDRTSTFPSRRPSAAEPQPKSGMTRARTWFDKLTTLSKVEGQRPQRKELIPSLALLASLRLSSGHAWRKNNPKHL